MIECFLTIISSHNYLIDEDYDNTFIIGDGLRNC